MVRKKCGFTLVELLLALALGAVLVVAVARTAHDFAVQVEQVREDVDRSLDEALDLVTESVRNAWFADVVSETRLELLDVYGNRTAFFLDGSDLRIRRPSGATGTLVGGVDDLSFTAETVRRYREDTTYSGTGTWWTAPTTTAPEVTLVKKGDAIGIAFSAQAAAPLSVPTVDDVEEHLLQAELGEVAVVMTYIPELEPPVFEGDPGKIIKSNDTIDVELWESRGLRDARTYGAKPLATMSIKASDIPQGSWTWEKVDLDVPPEGKSFVCHIPAGSDTKAQTLVVGSPALPSHVEHGDYAGPCIGGEDYALYVIPPTLPTVLDISGLGWVEPGKGYTLVFHFQGKGSLAFGMTPLVSSATSGVATFVKNKVGLLPQPVGIPFSISGNQLFTQTDASDVVSRVVVSIEMDDEREVTASAGVQSQLSADNPWLGVVAGELPTLEQAGL
jgi:prepilin-type N-terminal cleavage/methylation domain-containing protein